MAEFRLLGLVETWSGGRRVPMGQPRQRLVLAALLVDAGRPVTSEALEQRVWGDTPPAAARHALHEYLARIRRMLAGLDGDGVVRLTRRGGVYVLDVEPDRVDLHRFRTMVEQAREPGYGDAERVETLRQALELWRGEPLADLTGEWVQLVREASRRQRLEAAILWAQALFRMGRPAEAIEPLAQLAGENPLSEPVVAVLMRALHAAGMAVEALDWYTKIRKRLVEDLGAEPGPELQAVHQAVLRGEPASAPAPPEPGRSVGRRVVPAQLPVTIRSFAGRDAELARLDALLDENQGPGATVVICAVSGTAGVGKTALAVHWAHRVAARFPDGQLYVNLRGFDPGPAVTPAEAIRGFLDALDVAPHRISPNLSAQAALYRSLLAPRRMLVVLDNARDADQVRPLLPGASGCMVVVTSRRQLASLVALDGAHPLHLDVLTNEESRRLLARRLGEARVAAESDAVEEIIARCARLPLAFAVVAARAAVRPTLPLAALASQLSDVDGRLDRLSAGDAASDVRGVLSWSYQALSPGAAELFRLLGLHPAPDISAAAAASLAGVAPAEAAGRLAELVEAHLVMENAVMENAVIENAVMQNVGGRYSFHDLLRAYAIEQVHRVDTDEWRRAALHRLLEHYVYTADLADRFLNPTRDPIALGPPAPGVTPEVPADLPAAVAWFTAEQRILVAAVDLAAATGFDAQAVRLAWALTTDLHRRRAGEAFAATQRTAVAAAVRLGDPASQLRAHRSLARASIMLSRFDDAQDQLEQALALSVAAADPIAQAHTHSRLAYLAEVRGRGPEALEHARQALALYESAGHRPGQAHAHNGVGWYHAQLGDFAQALVHCRRAVALHEEVGDRDGQAAAWDSLGYAHHHLGQFPDAIACYRRGFDLLREIDDKQTQTIVLTHLAETFDAAGDPAAARATFEQVLAILEALDHPDAETVRAKLREL